MSNYSLLLGIIFGVLSTLTQFWTVAHLRPEAIVHAQFLVIGGAILRWVIAGCIILTMLSNGVMPALLTFSGMLITRWVMVFFFNKNICNRLI